MYYIYIETSESETHIIIRESHIYREREKEIYASQSDVC